jgi:ferredoxin
MRILADRARCVGAGRCVTSDPTVFTQDDEDGTVVVLVVEPNEDQLARVREAVDLCPSRALSLSD